MSKKKNFSISKGTKVYMRDTYGETKGQIDYNHLYIIRSIGNKEAILDTTALKEDEAPLYGYHRRGMKVSLRSKEESERYRENEFTRFYPWHWSQLLVPLGEEGWDAEMNV